MVEMDACPAFKLSPELLNESLSAKLDVVSIGAPRGLQASAHNQLTKHMTLRKKLFALQLFRMDRCEFLSTDSPHLLCLRHFGLL